MPGGNMFNAIQDTVEDSQTSTLEASQSDTLEDSQAGTPEEPRVEDDTNITTVEILTLQIFVSGFFLRLFKLGNAYYGDVEYKRDKSPEELHNLYIEGELPGQMSSIIDERQQVTHIEAPSSLSAKMMAFKWYIPTLQIQLLREKKESWKEYIPMNLFEWHVVHASHIWAAAFAQTNQPPTSFYYMFPVIILGATGDAYLAEEAKVGMDKFFGHMAHDFNNLDNNKWFGLAQRLTVAGASFGAGVGVQKGTQWMLEKHMRRQLNLPNMNSRTGMLRNLPLNRRTKTVLTVGIAAGNFLKANGAAAAVIETRSTVRWENIKARAATLPQPTLDGETYAEASERGYPTCRP